MASHNSGSNARKQGDKLRRDYFRQITPYKDAFQFATEFHRNPFREYRHVQSLYEDAQRNAPLRSSIVNNVASLQSIINDRELVQQSLYHIAKQMPETKKDVIRLKNQIDMIAQFQMDADNINLQNLNALKFISVELKKSSKQVEKQYNLDAGRKIPYYDEFENIRKQVLTTFDERIFKEGMINHEKRLQEYMSQDQPPEIRQAQFQQQQLLQEEVLDQKQTEISLRLYDWIGDSLSADSEQQLERAHIQQIQKEAQEGHNTMQSLGREVAGYQWYQNRYARRATRTKHERTVNRKAQWRQKQLKDQRLKWEEEQRMQFAYAQFVQKINHKQQKQGITEEMVNDALNYYYGDNSVKGMEILTPHFKKLLNKKTVREIERMFEKLKADIKRRKEIQLIVKNTSAFLNLAGQMINSVLSIANKTSAIQDQAQSMFSNMQSPLDIINGILGTQVSAISTQASQFPMLLGMVLEPLKFIDVIKDERRERAEKQQKKNGGGSQDDIGDKGETTKNLLVTILNFIVNALSSIVRIVATLFTVMQTVISNGIEMFISLLMTHIKLLKKIFETSKLMQQISNMFNLVISMFFMPFFNAFGNTIMEYIFNLLLWQASFNASLDSDIMKGMIDAQKAISSYLEEHSEQLKAIIARFIGEFLPMMIEVFFQSTSYVTYFTDQIIKNKDEFKTLLEKGIKASTALIKDGIITILLKWGTASMKFISKNKDSLKKMLEFARDKLQWVFSFLSVVCDYWWYFSIQLGAQLGGFLATALTLGYLEATATLSAVTAILGTQGTVQMFAEQQVMGAMSGSQIGAQVYYLFFSDMQPLQLKEGGFIPQTPGGRLVIVAEKETEYIIPESKIHMVRGHNNLIIDINGDLLGVDDTKQQIRQAINEQSNYQRFR